MDNFFANNDRGFHWWLGCVEDRDDPLHLGRCRVRILGYHTDSKQELKTEDLPWSWPIQPITSAGSSGVGWSPTGPVEGTWVLGFFLDGSDNQQPMMLGVIGGNPMVQAQNASGGSGTSDTGTGTPGSPGAGDEAPKFDSEEAAKLAALGCTTFAVNKIASGNKANMQAIITGLTAQGWGKYPDAIAAVLGIAGVESNWKLLQENMNYSASACVAKFDKFKEKDGSDLAQKYGRTSTHAANQEMIANIAYGGKIGNTAPGDGWKYRGRGFIQITFKATYIDIGRRIGADLLGNPDLLCTDPVLGAKAVAAFFATKGITASQLSSPGVMQILLTMVAGDKSHWNEKKELYACFKSRYEKDKKFI